MFSGDTFPAGVPVPGTADCGEVFLQLYRYLDGEMGEPDGARVQAHIEDCARCLAEYNADVLMKQMVQRSCECQEAPASLRAQIMTTITMVSVEWESDPDES